MRERSIFSGVARNENSHTELLCNLLHYSESFHALFYKFLTGESMPSERPRITTQIVSPDDGRPDLVFDYGGLGGQRNLIVEVKVRASRATTPYQAADSADAGYHRLGDLYFLVPRAWQHDFTATARVLTWEDFAGTLCRSPEIADDGFLREYLMLLDLEFPSIRFTEDERAMLNANGPSNVVTTAIKLHRTVDSLAQRFKEAGFKVEGSSDASEYGYYLRSRTSAQMVLGFGMWSTYDLLLGAGYENNWHKENNVEGFVQVQNSRWRVLSLNEMIMRNDDDLVGAIFSRLEDIVTSITAL